MFSDKMVESNRILYTPSVFAKKALFYLQETGTLTATKPHKSQHKSLLSYLFFTVTDGRGTLEYEGKTYSLKIGDCVFISCENEYAHFTDKNDFWTLKWIHCYGDTLPAVYQKYKERGGQPVFHPENSTEYINLIDKLFEIASSEDYLRDMRINETISILLTKIMEMSWNPAKQPDNKIGVTQEYSLQNVKDFLDENYSAKITLDQLSNKFYVNKYYLTRIFKEQYGVTIINYIINLRITDAKRKLRFSDKSIETIGYECGFNDANYFTRTFKTQEGMSPGEFRRKWM